MKELIKTGYDMLYLSLCALDNVTPDNERVQNLDNDMLFDLCQKHSLTSLVYYALTKVITITIKDRLYIILKCIEHCSINRRSRFTLIIKT